MTALLATLVLAVACWMLRLLFIVVVPAQRLPAPVREALRFLAPAVLASLVAVELVGALDHAHLRQGAVMVGALGLAAVLVHRTGSLALAVATGAVAALVVDVLLV